MTLSPKKLFLTDGLGAVLSAFLLGVVLLRFAPISGMPETALRLLAFIACVCAVYSLLCYTFIKERWIAYLKIIACTNLTYCCLTIGLLINFKKELTNLGWIYFLAELTVIIVLLSFELKTAFIRPGKQR